MTRFTKETKGSKNLTDVNLVNRHRKSSSRPPFHSFSRSNRKTREKNTDLEMNVMEQQELDFFSTGKGYAMIRKENKLEKNENEIEKDKNTILLQPQDIFSYHGSSCQELLIT